jgi:diadenosine tetraphosphate (Ap4A) HIT family hydrolase
MGYDMNNIFAKIIRGEIPSDKVYEDEHVLAFKDIRPQAKVHVLIIPKGPYVSAQDFSEKASDAEIVAVNRAIGKVAKGSGLALTGYRVIANTGADGRQEVPHYHIHIVGGQNMGRMISLD